MEKQDCFRILQISPEVTLKDARKAYMRLVKRWHPDQFANDPRLLETAQEKLKIINAAYEEVKAILSIRPAKVVAKSVSKPSPTPRPKPPEPGRPETVKPEVPKSFMSGFRSLIPEGIRRFFSSDPDEDRGGGSIKEKQARPSSQKSGKAEEKDFQKIFNEAVRSRTGKPYRPLKRAKKPVGRPERDPKATPQNLTSRRSVRPVKKTGDRVTRVEPVGKIKGSE